MLLEFLFELRRHKVPVGLSEWMALLEALARGLHESSLTAFYHLARALLCHTEASFDAFDQAFLAAFKGLEVDALALTEQILEWLDDPTSRARLSPAEAAALERLDLDELRRLFAARLREQRERHDGGSRWIGTGGTSPFGQGGVHPTGIKLGDAAGGRSAVLLAAERRFRAYRSDLVLDVRQIKVALRRLRDLRREGRRDELDLEATIDRTCRNAGELDLSWRAPRRNNVKLLLMMDVGGSMDPHAAVVSQLFSAAVQTKHFRDFHAFYFHNCVYEEVYRDAAMRDAVSVAELLRTYGGNYKLVLVGDAMMASWELFEYGGGGDWYTRKLASGAEWLRRLAAHFERKVWLNPEPVRFWNHHTVFAIRSLFPMFPLSLEGLDGAVQTLVKGKAPHPSPVAGPVWG